MFSFRASDAVEALKQKISIECRVLRDGKWVTLPARELVPGDVIRLRSGDIVPAGLSRCCVIITITVPSHQ
jgi:H+-transporting ATPase